MYKITKNNKACDCFLWLQRYVFKSVQLKSVDLKKCNPLFNHCILQSKANAEEWHIYNNDSVTATCW